MIESCNSHHYKKHNYGIRKRKNSAPTQPAAPLSTQRKAQHPTSTPFAVQCPLLPYLIRPAATGILPSALSGPFLNNRLLISCTTAPFTHINAYSSPAALHSNLDASSIHPARFNSRVLLSCIYGAPILQYRNQAARPNCSLSHSYSTNVNSGLP